MRFLLKNAIRYLKNAIVSLDVCSIMPLDIVIVRSKSLTLLYVRNSPISTCQLSLSHNDKCGPHLSGVSKRIILKKNKNIVGIKCDPTLYCSEIEGQPTCWSISILIIITWQTRCELTVRVSSGIMSMRLTKRWYF